MCFRWSYWPLCHWHPLSPLRISESEFTRWAIINRYLYQLIALCNSGLFWQKMEVFELRTISEYLIFTNFLVPTFFKCRPSPCSFMLSGQSFDISLCDDANERRNSIISLTKLSGSLLSITIWCFWRHKDFHLFFCVSRTFKQYDPFLDLLP